MALRYVARAQGDVDMYILAAIATVLVIIFAPWPALIVTAPGVGDANLY